MLILTRCVGEALVIGDSVVATVLDVKGLQVRIGTKAPKEVPVHREEVYNRLHPRVDERPQVRPMSILSVVYTPVDKRSNHGSCRQGGCDRPKA